MEKVRILCGGSESKSEIERIRNYIDRKEAAAHDNYLFGSLGELTEVCNLH